MSFSSLSIICFFAILGISLGFDHFDGDLRRDFNRQHEEFEPLHRRFDIHPRFRRQYYGMNGGGMGGGMGMGMMGGMGGMGQQMGGMGQQMFPGVMQSSKNSWGSFSSQREGGFNNQQQSLIMG